MPHLSRQSAWSVVTALLLSCLVATGFGRHGQHADFLPILTSDGHPIEVFASPLLQTIDRFAREHPQISDAKLAEYADRQLQKVGIDYDFDVGSFIEQNRLSPTRVLSAGLRPDESSAIYAFPLKSVDGRQRQFLMEVGGSGPCGERVMRLPVAKVTAHTFVLVTGGRQFNLQRPRSFASDSMDLVDEAMQIPVRSWEVPYESIPMGVSADGRSLYVQRFPFHGHELWLAISDRGITLEAAPPPDEQSAGEWVTEHPTDPNNDYLSFKRFRISGKTMIIRFSAPCT